MVKGVGVDVAAGQDGEEVLLGQRHLLPLDEVHALVLQRRWPVCVADQVAGEVLTDNELLKNKIVIVIDSYIVMFNISTH